MAYGLNYKKEESLMAKTVTFTYDKTAYTLEFTRETVSALEQNGLSLSDVQNIGDRPMTTVMMLFTGAFMAHHRKAATISGLIEKIWASIPDKRGLIDILTEMYTEPLDALMDEPDDEKGKTTWTVNK
jgi:hypothetical protein